MNFLGFLKSICYFCLIRHAAIAVFLLVALFYTPTFALELYENDSVSVSLDTSLSWGMQFRVHDRDNELIGTPEGGNLRDVNSDDGNLNFDKGVVSNAARITPELSIRGNQWGGFFRGTAFYDWELMQNDRERTQLTDDAKDEAGAKAEFLDAYVYGSHDIGAMPCNLRVGRQVINWGESLFIGNSINTLNPIDVTQLRVPGSELKEALKPLGSVYGSLGITGGLSFEAVYMFEWDKTNLDPLGTYWSTSDSIGPGAFKIITGYGAFPDAENAPVSQSPMAIPRGDDVEADDQGQYGLAMRYFSDTVETEFSAYFINYHSHIPSLNVKTATMDGIMAAAVFGDLDTFWATNEYSFEYVKDVRLFGLAFSTNLWGAAIQGEVSHRKDMPLAIDANEVFFAATGVISDVFAQNNQVGNYYLQPEQNIKGYILRDVTQAQVSMIKNLGRGLGMDTWNLLGEIGYTHVHDMPDKNELRLAGVEQVSGNEILGLIAHGLPIEDDDRFADADSAGYVLMLQTTKNDAFWSVNLRPRIAWSNDFYGNAPASIGTFQEGRQAVTLGITADYLLSWQIDISYTDYFGNGRYNALNDRDVIGFSIKYQF